MERYTEIFKVVIFHALLCSCKNWHTGLQESNKIQTAEIRVFIQG
jgi:hypothetical protein